MNNIIKSLMKKMMPLMVLNIITFVFIIIAYYFGHFILDQFSDTPKLQKMIEGLSFFVCFTYGIFYFILWLGWWFYLFDYKSSSLEEYKNKWF